MKAVKKLSDDKKIVRSIRADESTYSKFKSVCEELGGQQEGLTALLNAYELQQAKGILTGQATNIDDFTSRVDGIVKAYISALELTANTEERIRSEFAVQLDSQTKTIADLQAREEKAKTALSELKADTDTKIKALQSELTATKTALNSANEKAVNSTVAKEQAERIANMTAEQLESIKKQVADLTAKAEQSDRLKKSLDDVSMKLSDTEKALQEVKADRQRQIEVMQTDHKRQLDILKSERDTAVKSAIAETTLTYQSKISELQQQQAEQIKALSQMLTAKPIERKNENE